VIQKIKQNFNSDFAKNVLTLSVGAAIAQALPIAIMPIVSRIYTSEELGEYGVVLTYVLLLSTFASLELNRAIMLPRKSAESILITSSIVKYTFLFCLVLMVVFCLLVLFNQLKAIYLVIPILVFLSSLVSTLNMYLNRISEFKILAKLKVVNSLVLTILQVSTSILGALGLLVGNIAGNAVNLFLLVKKLFLNEPFKFTFKGFRTTFFKILKKYNEFPINSLPNRFVNLLSARSPYLVFDSFATSSVVGLYSMSGKIIQTPMSTLSASISTVFMNKSSEYHNSGIPLRPLVMSTYKNLLLIAVVPYLVFLFFAPEIFAFTLGSEWYSAGTYTQILIPFLFISFVNAPMNFIFFLKNELRYLLIFNISLLLARFGGLILGFTLFNGVYSSLYLYSIVGVVFHVFFFIKIYKVTTL